MTGASAKVAHLLTPPIFRVAPTGWQERLRQAQPREVVALRRATRTECPLGEPGFVKELETKFQVRLGPLPPGPPAKKSAQAKEIPVEIARQTGA